MQQENFQAMTKANVVAIRNALNLCNSELPNMKSDITLGIKVFLVLDI